MSGELHQMEAVVRDILDLIVHLVVLREALGEVRVVGIQQFEEAAVLADDAVEEQHGLQLADRRRSRRCSRTASR